MADWNESEYGRRVVDDELDFLLGALPAVSLDGLRAVGKTWTAQRRARAVYNVRGRCDGPPSWGEGGHAASLSSERRRR